MRSEEGCKSLEIVRLKAFAAGEATEFHTVPRWVLLCMYCVQASSPFVL